MRATLIAAITLALAVACGAPRPQPQPPKEGEQRFPFSIQGHNYVVIFQKKKPADAVVDVRIQDSTEHVIFQRSFPYKPESNDPSDIESDAWSADARMLSRAGPAGGTGLLMTYGEDAEPSAPTNENTNWYQMFGLVNGDLKPFSGPIAVAGELLDTQSDLLEFKVWAHHFRIILPIRIDWTAGKWLRADSCDTCEYKVLPEELRPRDDDTFARLCSTSQPQCENPERVLVKTDSKIDLVRGRAAVTLNGEEINVANDVWLLIRIDGREGWIHDEEDFYALGLPFEQ